MTLRNSRCPALLLWLLVSVPLLAQTGAGAGRVTVQVFKTSTCGCCSSWVAHLRQQGFLVNATDVVDLTGIKTGNHVPSRVASCHTALVGGYVIEGHVPAADIARLLKEKPDVVGIAVPGMPIGSPGMEGPNPQAYDVVTFDRAGGTTVFAHHRP